MAIASRSRRLVPANPVSCTRPTRPHAKLMLGLALILALSPALLHAALPVAEPGLPLLSAVQDVRNLSLNEAARRYPVKLRGVVTFYDPVWRTLFIQDVTGGVYVYPADTNRVSTPGDLVEIEGYTGTGFAPDVHETSYKVLGASPLPEPRRVTHDQMLSGSVDSLFVQVSGVVRSVNVEWGRLWVNVVSGGREFVAFLPNFAGKALPTNWIDGRADLRGVCGAALNDQNQMVGVWLFVPSTNYVDITDAPPTNTFSRPKMAVGNLLRPPLETPGETEDASGDSPSIAQSLSRAIQSAARYNPRRDEGHRILIEGIVTMKPFSGRMFIKDTSGAIEAHLSGRAKLRDPQGVYLEPPTREAVETGDRVEVVGYPAMGDYALILKDCEYRRLGSTTVPPPLPIDSAAAASGRHNADLVQLRARLIEHTTRRSPGLTNDVLILQDGDSMFEAHLCPNSMVTESCAPSERTPPLPASPLSSSPPKVRKTTSALA